MNTRYIVLLCLFSLLIDNVTSDMAGCTAAAKQTTNNATACNVQSTNGTGYCCLLTNGTTYSCVWGVGNSSSVATSNLVASLTNITASSLACASSRLFESILVLFGILIISLF